MGNVNDTYHRFEDNALGHGRYVFPSGAVYEGEYKAGQRHGKEGTYTSPDGTVVYKGEWENDQPKK